MKSVSTFGLMVSERKETRWCGKLIEGQTSLPVGTAAKLLPSLCSQGMVGRRQERVVAKASRNFAVLYRSSGMDSKFIFIDHEGTR